MAMIAIWLIIMTISPKQYRKRVKNTLKSFISLCKDNGAIGPQKVTLREDDIEIATAKSTACIRYDALHKVYYTGAYIIIYTGENHAITIPISAFINEKQQTDFLEMLKIKITKEIIYQK